MAESRILGTVGKFIKVTGTIETQPRRLGRLKQGRFQTVYSYLMKNVKTSEGKKFSHLWFDLDEPIQMLGKIATIKGRVAFYRTANTSGTNLHSVKLLGTKEKNQKKDLTNRKK